MIVRKEYIEIIKHDSQNLKAFKGLGNLYMDKKQFREAKQTFEHVLRLVEHDEIKTIIANHLTTQTTDYWLTILEAADIWCAKVLEYKELVEEEAYQKLQMEIVVKNSSGLSVTTTRCPIRIDGNILTSDKGAPFLGEDNQALDKRFSL